MLIKRQHMHIDTAYQITVADKATFLAAPNPAFGLMFMPTSGTLATCSSFGASEAQDAGLFRFMGQIINVFAIFPQGHTLIMVAAIITVAHTMRIADEEASHLMLNAEVNHLTGGFVSHITDTPFSTPTHFILGTLQLLPPMRILLAAGLLLGDLSQALGALPLETTNTTPCDDHRLTCVGADGGKVVK